jgi:hypothetical protein
VGIDRPDDPDDPDLPPDDHSDPPARRPPAETRYRQEYDADLRAACAAQERTEPAGPSEPGTRSKPAEATEDSHQAQASTTWEETAELSRSMWTEYKRRWPPEERPLVDRSTDPPGSWRGEGDRYLNPPDNAKIEVQCDRLADLEREKITPALRAVESQDPNRYLVGLKDCIKGRDRIKEKVYDDMDLLGRSSSEAISALPDAIRYTFQYDEARYTQSVRADIARVKEQGFKLNILKNSWSDDQYKGINSQWMDPGSGQRFELQFHTRISFEAKQITHSAYERLRTHQADALEELVLEAFQRKVTGAVPVPYGATEIPD